MCQNVIALTDGLAGICCVIPTWWEGILSITLVKINRDWSRDSEGDTLLGKDRLSTRINTIPTKPTVKFKGG